MIKVENLTRKYSKVTAVDNISFEVGTGEVIGLLGPNGAGKTTTLKVLTGYLAPTNGKVEINDIDVEREPISFKKFIGYLPENNPLYEDMEVSDFLKWNAEVRQMPKAEIDKAVKDAVKKCGLSSVIGKNISDLSKGYKQRVGLANAILHNPKILMLDEPTSGLDPNQAHEVRGLVNELKREKTIILSTHILSEVKYVCDRVVIINNGKIVANQKTSDVEKSFGKEQKIKLVLGSKANLENVKKQLLSIIENASLSSETLGNETEISLSLGNDKDVRGDIFKLAIKNDWPLLELKRESVSLEDIFRSLTT
jgi:gliding motility-associated transport system ATP-binding protein